MIRPDDERVQLPDSPLILWKRADPSEEPAALDRCPGKSLHEHVHDVPLGRVKVGPARRLYEPGHQQFGRLDPHRVGLIRQVDNGHCGLSRLR